jgi:hypothetical protein
MLEGMYDPRRAVPLDPEQFSLLLNLATKAGQGEIPTLDPEKMSFSLFDEETGEVEQYWLTDHPLARMALTARSFYQDDPAKYFSAMYRLHGLMNIVRRPELAPWTHDEDEITTVHDAVVEAAAKGRLDEHGLFPVGPFLKLVRQIEGEGRP